MNCILLVCNELYYGGHILSFMSLSTWFETTVFRILRTQMDLRRCSGDWNKSFCFLTRNQFSILVETCEMSQLIFLNQCLNMRLLHEQWLTLSACYKYSVCSQNYCGCIKLMYTNIRVMRLTKVTQVEHTCKITNAYKISGKSWKKEIIWKTTTYLVELN